MPYVQQMASLTHNYQFPDGPVIGEILPDTASLRSEGKIEAVQSENEFFNSSDTNDPTASEAMAILNAAFYANGIDRVPLTTNDYMPLGDFASGLGSVDV